MNDRQLWPSIMLVTAAAGWGLFWIPLRELEGAGLSAGWAGFSQFVTPALVLLPLALIFMVRGKATGMGRWKTAFFTGGAFALYADSLLLTEVARALILFYVTPAWSTMLEVWLMKRKVTAARIIAITWGLRGSMSSWAATVRCPSRAMPVTGWRSLQACFGPTDQPGCAWPERPACSRTCFRFLPSARSPHLPWHCFQSKRWANRPRWIKLSTSRPGSC